MRFKLCKANKELLTWSKHPRGTSKAPRCHPQGQVRAVVCWIRNRNRNRKRNRNLLRRVRQQLMPKVDIGARGREEKREEEQGLESRDCASSRTAGGWRQTWRGVEVRVCMQLACLASRCGEGGEVEGYKAPGCWDAVIRTSRRGLGAMVVRWSLGGPV